MVKATKKYGQSDSQMKDKKTRSWIVRRTYTEDRAIVVPTREVYGKELQEFLLKSMQFFRNQ